LKNLLNYYKIILEGIIKILFKDPSIIIQNFILDCSKENNENMDLDLARQFKKIAMFYKKKSAGKIKDPRVNQIFELLDKNFAMLDIKDDDVNDDFDSDVEIEEINTENKIEQ